VKVLELENVCKNFGPFKVVNNLSFSLKKGEVLGFLGPNGAGKTTTMRMITGFLMPSSGYIKINGRNIEINQLDVKKNIGYVPEGAPLYSEMTVISFLNFIADLRLLFGKERSNRLSYVIDKLKIESVLLQSIETLSKGFKRRVGLAQAILHDPEILIFDEPTDGLDPNQKQDVRTLINEMSSEKVIIISTHILEEVDAVCNRAMIISEGNMLVDDIPSKLISNYQISTAVKVKINKIANKIVIKELKTIKDINKVEIKEGFCIAYSKSQKNLMDTIITFIKRKKWTIDYIENKTVKLEEVFQSLTKSDKK
tara:strand:- start:69 stop:1001 length:933 start_codon:yes stop_codon:yes gene_type:complete